MFNWKKETIKKNIFLILSIISTFIFIAGVMCSIMGEDSPVKFIINKSLIKLVVPPALVFFIKLALYRNCNKFIEEDTK